MGVHQKRISPMLLIYYT